MFEFELNEKVRLGIGETLVVIVGRAEYIDRPNQYHVRRYNDEGQPVYEWFDECDLTKSG